MSVSSFRYLYTFLIFLGTTPILSARGYCAVSDVPGNRSLSGKVTEKSKGSPLAGATVYITDLKVGTVTDKDGNYKISSLPSGTYLVEVRYVGYAAFYQNVDFAKTTVLDVQLSLSTL